MATVKTKGKTKGQKGTVHLSCGRQDKRGRFICLADENEKEQAGIRYVSSFTFSPKTIRNTNVYPYNVFNPKAGQTIPLGCVAKMIEAAARFHAAQLVVSTHSPFVIGSLDATILDLNCAEIIPRAWHELENYSKTYARTHGSSWNAEMNL